MSKWQQNHRKVKKSGPWRPYVAPINNPFIGLSLACVTPQVANVAAKKVKDEESHRIEEKFIPPEGPRHLPLSQCPHLAALLRPRDKKIINQLADSLLTKRHDLGFAIMLKPVDKRIVLREIFGRRQQTFASWKMCVRRRWRGNQGGCQYSDSEHMLHLDDGRTLAAALFLADRLDANLKKIFLYKPFRSSAFVEAWLSQKMGNVNPMLMARAKDVGGRAYVDKDGGKVELSGERPRGLPAEVNGDQPQDSVDATLLRDVSQDLMANYANGFDFKETSLRLVEARIGKQIPKSVIEALRSKMFERSDGLWLFQEMVVSDENLRLMHERAQLLLDEEGAFAMDSFFAEFEGALYNILNGQDFKRFFNKFIADRVFGRVRGHGGWRVCFKSIVPEDEGWNRIADRVRDILVMSGDAVSIDDILRQLPYLDREVVLRVSQEHIRDAVTFTMDEIEYLKLLEAYYLPDDFSAVLSAFVNDTEAANGVPSIVLLEAEFDAKFGEGFRVNYGLEDDSVFKQVVLKSFSGVGHEWKKDMFVGWTRRAESNVAEVFLQNHEGIFHEEDFFKFALETRGMLNRGMLITTFLRKHCVRLSKEWWLAQDEFARMFGLEERHFVEIGNALNSALGNDAFRPISNLPQELFESLPRLEHDGRVYEWNPYLLTSVAVWKIQNARVINDEPSPYTVTSMIVPANVGEIKDVVEYVIRTYPRGYFKDADSAFDYLKSNYIRMTKTEKLIAKLNDCLRAI